MYAKESQAWYRVFEREQALQEYGAIQPWSKGPHFPAVIAKVEYYSDDGVLFAEWHEVILGSQNHAFPDYDAALTWALEAIRGH